LGCEGEPVLKAFLADPNTTGPARALDQRLLRERLAEVLRSWPPPGREGIEPRFGLWDGRPKALKEVARAHGITRERIP
jgi:DNA-directed RNA polymerase sigma subunit (sigma70/sigma32)